MDMQDLQEDIEEATPTDILRELGKKAFLLDAAISELTADAAARKKALTTLLEKEIPEAMTEAGLGEFGFETPEGGNARMTAGVKVVGSLSKAPDQEAAIRYLEETGFEGVVKTALTVDLTEEERGKMEDMMSAIKGATNKYPHAERKLSPATLAAFGRQKIAEDPTWDFEKVGLTAIRAAKFTKRK